jgi:hypothetical protein
MLIKNLSLALSVTVALGMSSSALAGQAGDVLDPNTLGAAVAAPYLTNAGGRTTVVTLTNGSDHKAVTVHLNWISGSDWTAIDYDCPLTPLETTYFVFEASPDTDNAVVTFECSNLGQEFPNPDETNNVVTRAVNGRDGLMFATIECQLGSENCDRDPRDGTHRTLPNNILSADLVVMDFAQGVAFSAPAIHIQGVPRIATTAVPDMDGLYGDRLYTFTGHEGGDYKSFPSLLTTNYIAPDDSVTAELLLFTLDGSLNSGPGIKAKVAGFAYDDDENPTSGQITFDCMDLVAIDASPNGFGLNVTRPFGGHRVGQLQLFPAVVARSDVGELDQESGADGVRRAPVHGYILQTISARGRFAGGEFGGTMAANAAWMRQLTQGTNPLIPTKGDEPRMDARVTR